MKTTSKLLSMLLLVAMCLSLMGGSAYALAPLDGTEEFVSERNSFSGGSVFGLAPIDGTGTGTEISNTPVQGITDGVTSKGLVTSGIYGVEDIEVFSAEGYPWSVKGSAETYQTLEKALAAANSGATIVANNTSDLTGSLTIGKSVTIDLGGNWLNLNGNAIVISSGANVTFQNGYINNDDKEIASVSGTLHLIGINAGYPKFGGNGDVNIYNGCTFSYAPDPEDMAPGFVYGEDGGTHTYVARIGNQYFDSADAAINAAKDGDTVIFITDTSVSKDIDCYAVINNKDITLDLGGNGLIMHGSCINNSDVTVKGTVLRGYGDFTISNSNLVLGNGTSISNDGVLVDGGSITVNGGSVSQLSLSGDATLKMGNGSIGNLTVYSGTLSVSGGTVEAISASNGLPRAITGGKWKVDEANLAAFKTAIADGYEAVAENGYYIVRKIGSSSGNDGSFNYTWYGSPYTKNSGKALYAEISGLTDNGYGYYLSRDSFVTATNYWALKNNQYDVASRNGYYVLTLKNSYLDTLASGTYYAFLRYNGKDVNMGSFVIDGNNNGIVNPGDVAVWPVDENEWYSGDPMLAFNYRPAINDKGIEVDGWTVPGIDYVNNFMGTLKLGTSYLGNLSRGWHTLTINTDSGRASCDFYIGATLKPVDTDKHVTGSSKNLQFVCTDPISRVWVGGRELGNSDYEEYFTLSSSRKTITLTAKFLNNRTAGETYTLTVQTDNGDTPSCTFQILTRAQASSSPRTGDESNLALWAALLIVSGGAAIAVLPRVRKHEN